jgi:putative tryptophan/tyrosine transport system substrate-binding protein
MEADMANSSVGRREFISLFGGAVATWPHAARAQAVPVIGFLNSTSPDPTLQRVAAFRQGLQELGYVGQQNVAIEFRWAENQHYRLQNLAADLVRRRVAVIAATGGTSAALAAKHATSTIPIVFEIGGDPMAAGLVDDHNGSRGNLTGISLNVIALAQSQFELLRKFKPKASLVAMFVNPDNPNRAAQQARVEAAARAIGMQTLILYVNKETGFDQPFMTLVQRRADALFVSSDSFFLEWRREIVALAALHSVPTIYPLRAYVAEGGLISYGASIIEGYHHVGVYVGRILKGEKPGDLPLVNAIKFKLAINVTTARTMGLDLPAELLASADEVIQ